MVTQNTQHNRRSQPINIEGVRSKMSLTNILTVIAMIGGLFGVYSNNQSEVSGLKIQVQNIKDIQSATKGDIGNRLDKLENKIDLLLADRRPMNNPSTTIIERKEGR